MEEIAYVRSLEQRLEQLESLRTGDHVRELAAAQKQNEMLRRQRDELQRTCDVAAEAAAQNLEPILDVVLASTGEAIGSVKRAAVEDVENARAEAAQAVAAASVVRMPRMARYCRLLMLTWQMHDLISTRDYVDDEAGREERAAAVEAASKAWVEALDQFVLKPITSSYKTIVTIVYPELIRRWGHLVQLADEQVQEHYVQVSKRAMPLVNARRSLDSFVRTLADGRKVTVTPQISTAAQILRCISLATWAREEFHSKVRRVWLVWHQKRKREWQTKKEALSHDMLEEYISARKLVREQAGLPEEDYSALRAAVVRTVREAAASGSGDGGEE